MSNPLKREINNVWLSGSLMALTPLIVVVIGILSLDITLQWGGTTTNAKGEIEYANHLSFKGWEAVPIQALAGLVGTTATAYGAYKLSHKPAPPEPYNEPSELS